MTEKLAAVVLGNRNSGKSTTWNTLFQRTVKTGRYQRELHFNRCEYSWVFLVSGSPEERETYIADIIADEDPSIILSSLQYGDDVADSFEYFVEEGYQLYVQWLNPGYSDESPCSDSLGLVEQMLAWGATVKMADGSQPLEPRVREIRNFIYGWAKPRGLVVENQGWV